MAKSISAILNLKDNFSKTLQKTTANTKQFQRQMKKVSNTAKDMQKAVLSSFSKIAGGIAIGAIAKESIQLASDLQEVQNVVDVTFGESADKINEFAKSALKNFGLSELQAKQFNGTLGALMKSSGVSSDKLLEMSTTLTGLSADFASFYNLDPEEAFEKIKSGISGETEPLKALGINMSVTNMNAYALAQGIGKTYDQMSQGEQTLLRYNYLLSVSSDANGDFARTSDSFANQLRIAKVTMQQVGASVASIFLPALNKGLIFVNKFIGILPNMVNELSDLFERLKTATDIGDVFYLIGESLNDALFAVLPRNVANAISDIYISITTFLTDLINSVISVSKDLVEPFKSAFGEIITFISNVGNDILYVFTSISNNSGISIMITGLGELLKMLLSDIKGVFNFFNDNWSILSPIIYGLVGAMTAFKVITTATTTAITVLKAVKTAWATVTGVINTAMLILNGTLALSPIGWITLLIGALIAIGVLLYQNWDIICAKASALWTTISTVFSSIGNKISEVFNTIKSTIKGMINSCIDGINSLINGLNQLLSFKVPDWIPGLGGKSVSVDIPNVPKFATGTQYFKGGLAQINERGGELVNLPNGSKVIPADKTDKLLSDKSAPTINITVQGNVIGNHEFINEMGSMITQKLKLALAN